MKPAEDIKKLNKNIKIKTNPEVNQAVLSHLLNRLDKTKESQPAPYQPNFWRIIMKSRITKLATVSLVALIIAGVLYFGLIDSTATAAERLQEVIELNANYEGWLHITYTFTHQASKDSPLSNKGILHKNEKEAARIGKEVNAVFPTRATIWVDINTNLICKSENETRSVTIEYGEPFISDIYDFDIPQNTRVADYRKNLSTEAVLSRLERRMTGFNHYIAIMTETPLNEDGAYNKKMCAIHLFSQDNKRWLANRYLVGVDSYANGKYRASIMETPESWPSVEIMSMLEKIKGKRPSEFYVYDGENLWSQFSVMPKSISAESKKATIDRIKNQTGLARKIWFGSCFVRYHGPGTKVEVINKNDEPNQIGLRIEFSFYVKPSVKQRCEEYYWFDPERDDMPTERIFRDYLSGSQAIENEFHTVYLNYSRLLDGRWYPSKWRMTTVSNLGGQSHKYTREYHLFLNDAMELEKDWFTNPLERSKD